jgi:hypothetical protein
MTPEQSRSLKIIGGTGLALCLVFAALRSCSIAGVLGGIASAGQDLWQLGEKYDKEQFRKKVEAREVYDALQPAEAAAARARAASEGMAMGERFRLQAERERVEYQARLQEWKRQRDELEKARREEKARRDAVH